MDLFETLINAGDINGALLAGKNLVNRNPGDADLFYKYISLLFDVANSSEIEECKNYLNQIVVTKIFFEENTDITVEVIRMLGQIDEKIAELADRIAVTEQSIEEEILSKIIKSNDQSIKQLYIAKDKLLEVDSHDDMDSILKSISVIDANIDQENMTDKQREHYELLNKECTEYISNKMRELEHKDNVEYNKKAVDAFSNAFKLFKSDEKKYKNQTALFSLVSSSLFAYDAAKLFNETLIYYNHVYSFIFSKLDDDGKLALTRYSIDCERRER